MRFPYKTIFVSLISACGFVSDELVATIIFNPLGSPVSLPGSSENELSLDLNGDSQIDFSFFGETSSAGGSPRIARWARPEGNNAIFSRLVSSGFTFTEGELEPSGYLNYGAALTLGQVIGPALFGGNIWSTDNALISGIEGCALAPSPDGNVCAAVPVRLGFFEDEISYLGVLFEIENNSHYGWIEIQLDSSGRSIAGWAYESEPGATIIAGAVPIPEPSVYLSLLTGLALLTCCRRKPS